MKSSYLSSIQRQIMGILCFIVVVGCVSFRGTELPRYTYEQIVPHDKKPSIDYDAIFIGSDRNSHEKLHKVNLIKFQEEITTVFSKGDMFSKFSKGIGSEEHHLTLVLYYPGERASTLMESYYKYLSGLTLCALPYYSTEDYFLIVDVKNGNHVLKQYRYKQSMYTVNQLLLIFFTWVHSKQEVERGIIDDMLLNLLHDLNKDNILELPS